MESNHGKTVVKPDAHVKTKTSGNQNAAKDVKEIIKVCAAVR